MGDQEPEKSESQLPEKVDKIPLMKDGRFNRDHPKVKAFLKKNRKK